MSRHGSWSGVQPKPFEFVRDETSGVELSELRCRNETGGGADTPSPGNSAEHVGPALADLG